MLQLGRGYRPEDRTEKWGQPVYHLNQTSAIILVINRTGTFPCCGAGAASFWSTTAPVLSPCRNWCSTFNIFKNGTYWNFLPQTTRKLQFSYERPIRLAHLIPFPVLLVCFRRLINRTKLLATYETLTFYSPDPDSIGHYFGWYGYRKCTVAPRHKKD
jgi:hypothetical protein